MVCQDWLHLIFSRQKRSIHLKWRPGQWQLFMSLQLSRRSCSEQPRVEGTEDLNRSSAYGSMVITWRYWMWNFFQTKQATRLMLLLQNAEMRVVCIEPRTQESLIVLHCHTSTLSWVLLPPLFMLTEHKTRKVNIITAILWFYDNQELVFVGQHGCA